MPYSFTSFERVIIFIFDQLAIFLPLANGESPSLNAGNNGNIELPDVCSMEDKEAVGSDFH